MKQKYSNEEILAAAKMCASRIEFYEKHAKFYQAALRRGILDQLFAALPVAVGHVSAYSDADLAAHAKQFSSRQEWEDFGKNERRSGIVSHYGCARKRGRAVMRQCCAHMAKRKPPTLGKYRYSDDTLLQSARKFETRGAWKNADKPCYHAALSRPIWDECVAHMRPAANPFASDYVIYAYEFTDKHVYVGLTVVPENRKYMHTCRGPVFEHTKLCPSKEYRILQEKLAWKDAGLAEDEWQKYYASEGWTALHSAKAGSLGGIHGSKWTKELVIADARQYATRQEWIKNGRFAYNLAKREGWFDEAVAHMPRRVLGVGAGIPKSVEARAKMSVAAQRRGADPRWKIAHSARVKAWHAKQLEAREAGVPEGS